MKNNLAVLALTLLTLTACGGSDDAGQPVRAAADRPGMRGTKGGSAPSAAVPVQVEPVPRRSISQYLETNGTLEAENEVDIVARTSGPVTEILTEEGRLIRAGQLIARIDEREAENQVAISTVARDEAKLAFDRTKNSWDEGLVSQEAYDTALSKLSSAEAQLESAEIQLAYTEITAPFDALVVTRDIKLAQYVTPGTTLFRISDFTPLLCRVEVPEKDFSRIRVGQTGTHPGRGLPGRQLLGRGREASADRRCRHRHLHGDPRGRRARQAAARHVRLGLSPDRDPRRCHRHPAGRARPRLARRHRLCQIGDDAERREVRLGLRSENSVEVLEGLARAIF